MVAITILGKHSHSVECNNNGKLEFESCNNVNIEGFVWD